MKLSALITEYSKMMGSRTQRSSLYVDYRAVTEYASDVVIWASLSSVFL